MKQNQAWVLGAGAALLAVVVLALGATRVLPQDNNGQPSATVPPGGSSAGLTGRAIAQLSSELGVSADKVTVVAVEAVEWPDSSLGCPAPDTAYTQVITPGYRIRLAVAATTYEFHTTEQAASPLVRCAGQ